MPGPPDVFFPLAIERAASPEVAEFLRELAGRTITVWDMIEQLSAQTLRRREAETGKPFKLTRAQERTVAHFTEDPAKLRAEMERSMLLLDDAGLLIVARSNEESQLELDEALLKAMHLDDLELAKRIVAFRWETLSLIEAFIETSPLKEAIRATGWLKPRFIVEPPR